MSSIELASGFGKTLLDCLNGGALGELLAQYLISPFSQNSRLALRAKVDLTGGDTGRPCIACRASGESHRLVYAVLTRDCFIQLSGSSAIHFESPVVAFDSLLADVLAVGLANGSFQIWKIISHDQFKCLFRYAFPMGVVASVISASEEVIHVVPSKGKCLVSFDTIAALSGQSTAPVICDLFASASMATNMCNLVATVGGHAVIVTDWHSQTSQSILVSNATQAWWLPNGHLLVLTSLGTLMDASWSNGLVGVATKRPMVGDHVAVHQIDHLEEIHLADCNYGIFASVNDATKVLTIYQVEQGRYQVSPVTTRFTLLQEESLAAKDVVGISVISKDTCGILVQDEQGIIKSEYIQVASSNRA